MEDTGVLRDGVHSSGGRVKDDFRAQRRVLRAAMELRDILDGGGPDALGGCFGVNSLFSASARCES